MTSLLVRNGENTSQRMIRKENKNNDAALTVNGMDNDGKRFHYIFEHNELLF